MQLLTRYLVKNKIDIIVDLAGFTTEFRPMYKRQLNVYKGIDNVLEFRILNADQKPVSTENYTPKFCAFDEDMRLVIEHTGTVLDDGSSTTRGLFTVTITENDLLNVKQQYLRYNIYLVDNSNNNILTYTDTHFGADASIKIISDGFPSQRPNQEVLTFTKLNGSQDIWYSEAVAAEPGINGNEALHTAVIYSEDFTGNIVIQGTLDNQVVTGTHWSDITTVNLDYELAPTPVNFVGVFTHIRFKTTANPTNKISKILVRN